MCEVKERWSRRRNVWVYVLLAGTLPATEEGVRPVLFRPLVLARDKARVADAVQYRVGKFVPEVSILNAATNAISR